MTARQQRLQCVELKLTDRSRLGRPLLAQSLWLARQGFLNALISFQLASIQAVFYTAGSGGSLPARGPQEPSQL